MIGTLITFFLLAISLLVTLVSFIALIRGIIYQPTPTHLDLRITQRTETPSQWFTLRLQRPWYWRWYPLPRFCAGQSIAITPNGSKSKRRYSLARWSRWPFYYQVTIKREPNGKVSNALWSTTQLGQILRITPPSGEFVIEPKDKSIVFIAGGVGITPLLAMLDEYLPRSKPECAIHLFWQVRFEHEWIYQNDLQQLANTYPQLTLHLLASKPETPEQPAQRIDKYLLQSRLGELHKYQYYLCASNALLDDICSGLENSGVATDNIHFERFSIANGGTTGTWKLQVNDQPIRFEGHKTLLDALDENDITLPSDCRTGSCGQCLVTITQGQTRQIITPEFMAPAGKVLACCSIPLSDLSVSINQSSHN
jgi:ferredoxin-NADP reductase